MKQEKINILTDDSAFNKFCVKNDKAFGCKDAFHCSVCCPLWMAREVQYLVNEKGMTIGEAHRACMRKDIPENEAWAIIGDAVKAQIEGKKAYPSEGSSDAGK